MVMSFLNIGKSAFQTFFGLLFTIDCILNGRTNVIIMFGSFFSNLLNFPFLLVTTGLITLICIFSKISHSIFTSILILSLLRHISVDICALLSSSFIEIWISASICLMLVISLPVGLGLGLIFYNLSNIAKFSFALCMIPCIWAGFFYSNELLPIFRNIQVYSQSIIFTIALIHIFYLLTKSNSRFQSIIFCLILFIGILYPDLKRQFITKFSNFELIDSSLSTNLVTIVNDHELDVKIMRIDHSIVGGVFNEGFESVFETFYWYELACYVPWLKSSPEVREKRSLVIGCGVGIVVDALVNRCKFDQVIVVDNNADVLKFASKYFNLSGHASLINRDGLEFMIAQDANTFELIVHDIFSGLFMHNNNYIQDLISNCFRILSNNGILVLNLVANVDMEILHHIMQQFQNVFKQSRCFCEGGINSLNTGALVNFVFFASKSEKPIQFVVSNYHRAFQSALKEFKSSEIQVVKRKNYNKINQHQIEWIAEESHFKSMRKMLPLSFWLLY